MVVRPGFKVRLINDERVRYLERTFKAAKQNDSIGRVQVGTEGVVIATRPLIDDAILVKFKGYGYQLSISKQHLEVIS